MDTDLIIAIKTAGFRHDQDYRWVKWPETIDPDNVIEIISDTELFIDDRSVSLILKRIESDHWLLTVKALASTRRDFDNTPIRNAIALVGPSALLPRLVSFASRLLQSPDEMARKIDACIGENVGTDRSKFRVEFSQLKELVRETPVPELSGEAKGVPLVGKYSDPALWSQLADQLVSGSFPTQHQTLVLVSKHCSFETLVSLRPYRTLSDVAVEDEWQRTDELVHARRLSTPVSLRPTAPAKAFWVAMAIAVGIVWWWSRSRR